MTTFYRRDTLLCIWAHWKLSWRYLVQNLYLFKTRSRNLQNNLWWAQMTEVVSVYTLLQTAPTVVAHSNTNQLMPAPPSWIFPLPSLMPSPPAKMKMAYRNLDASCKQWRKPWNLQRTKPWETVPARSKKTQKEKEKEKEKVSDFSTVEQTIAELCFGFCNVWLCLQKFF